MFMSRSLLCFFTIIYEKKEKMFEENNMVKITQFVCVHACACERERERDLSPPYLFHPWISVVKEQIPQCDR